MAHPIIEALYIGLLTSGLSQPVDAPRVVITPPVASPAVQMPARPRVVYDWAAGERLVFTRAAHDREPSRQPMVGITDEQVQRMVGGPVS
jgi:hypothetical protein